MSDSQVKVVPRVGDLQSWRSPSGKEYPEMVSLETETDVVLSQDPFTGTLELTRIEIMETSMHASTTAPVIRDPDSGAGDGNQEHALAIFGRYCLEMGYPDFVERIVFPSDSLVRQSMENRISTIRHWEVVEGDVIADNGIKYPGPPPKFIADNDIVALIPLLHCGEWEWYGWNREPV